MTDSNGPDDLVLRRLRSIEEKLDRVLDDSTNIKSRMTALEASMALVNSRLDRIETRLDRIERRTGLIEAP